MEETHVDLAETQEDQIARMGIQNYLTIQLNKEEGK
jgi:bacterioferritin (cytochrome b1)